MNTLRIKIIKEKKIITVMLVVIFLGLTVAIKSSPIIFCNFVSWLGKCEECYSENINYK